MTMVRLMIVGAWTELCAQWTMALPAKRRRALIVVAISAFCLWLFCLGVQL
jgi:hypothetical protein